MTQQKYKADQLEVVIGLEIHAQISTKTKMFSADSAEYFGKEPNITVSEISMGFPGQLPVVNKDAVYKGVKAAMALNCKINKESYFDRKNYFYPDLPKGYQISQFENPVSENGYVEIKIEDRKKKVRITRLHLEEDAGKLTHIQGGSLVDFNRSGVGLMEIVSEPDISSAEEAVAYAKIVQMILKYTEASDADMEKGMMRFDASVSLRPKGEEKLYPRAEIKNLNSFRSLETAIKYEIKRQSNLWENREIPTFDSTVGYDDTTGKTYFMRNKEGSDDYRYFPDPDLPPLILDDNLLDSLKSEIPELPDKKYSRYLNEFNLSEAEALYLVEDVKLNKFFDQVYYLSNDSKKTASFVLSIMLGMMKKEEISMEQMKISPENIADLIKLVNSGDISMNIAKSEVFETMFFEGGDPAVIIEKKGLKSINNEDDLEAVCKQVIAMNQQAVDDYKNGKENAFKALMGQVMKETKGQANPVKVTEIIKNLLK
ncbi:Asp-tRNA(Asn)/Glu-tRNA(Gln) amidotransferase subunit GatB [Candidatus Peregrinibacteria bacterium]|nr:Asp-tRNA(Asn)/Glu-tRNA(Gln) amidotransferase subunit GatB [Candidatus Peregrinibacteria bacterium]